jgi:general L-amino acid transport system permease protein
VTTTDAPPVRHPAGRGRGVGRLLFNVRVLRIAAQVVFLLAVGALILYFADNYRANTRGDSGGWSFLREPAGFGITDTDFRGGNSNWQAIVIGIRNTLLSAIVGIILATALGLVVGVMRLSRNWVVQKTATLYVETLRNIPVLLIILFASAAFRPLPPISEAATPLGWFVISNQWVAIPSLIANDPVWVYVAMLVAAVVAALLVARWRTRVSERTGVPHHRVLYAAGIVAGAALVGWFVIQPFDISLPRVEDAVIVGGFRIGMVDYAPLTVALGLYHASHIAEIVRGSILSVPKGQTEASTALGLKDFQRLRYVTLPQALRVAVPPTLNQYLSLTKNTSLGIAVAYSDLFNIINRIVNTGSPALEAFALAMAIYLTISLVTSALINLVNRHFQLVER